MEELLVSVLTAATSAWLLNGLPCEMGAKAFLKMRAADSWFRWVEARA